MFGSSVRFSSFFAEQCGRNHLGSGGMANSLAFSQYHEHQVGNVGARRFRRMHQNLASTWMLLGNDRYIAAGRRRPPGINMPLREPDHRHPELPAGMINNKANITHCHH
ncbi:hypothetical protein WI664_00735 [Vibrio cholerae]